MLGANHIASASLTALSAIILLISVLDYSGQTSGGKNKRACVAVVSIKCQTRVIKTSQARFSPGQHPALEFTTAGMATGLAGT